MPRASLHDLYLEGLRDLHHAAGLLVKVLPRLARAADARELKAAFEEHLVAARGQVDRLAGIFDGLGEKAAGRKSRLMAALVEEAREAVKRPTQPAVRDAALIGVGQRVAHFGMAGYECVRTYARLLGYEEAADVLQEALDEEAEADVRLTELAQEVILVESDDEEQPVATKTARKRKAGRRA